MEARVAWGPSNSDAILYAFSGVTGILIDYKVLGTYGHEGYHTGSETESVTVARWGGDVHTLELDNWPSGNDDAYLHSYSIPSDVQFTL